MLSEIDILKEKLDKLIQQEAPYSDIYHLSCEIDKLLVKYYSNQECLKIYSCENSNNPNIITNV